MRFHIENDVQDSIVGWLVPDNPLALSRVAVAIEGRRTAEVPASVVLPDIKSWGWHSTGLCAFVVNEEAAPGITEAKRVELYDADTNVLLYRRPIFANTVQGKFLILDPSLVAETAIQNALFPHFHMSYFGAGRLSEETLTFIVDNQFTTSLCVAGNLLFARYEEKFYRNEFMMCIRVGDAYVELARRILWLRARAPVTASPDQHWRVSRLDAPIAFAESLALEDIGVLKKAFRSLDQETYNFLSNPLTRSLACRLPDERLEPFHPSQALEALSRFHIVGHEDFWDAYVATCFGKLGLVIDRPEAPRVPEEVATLADALRRTGTARAIIEYDVVLSEAVRGVVAKQWAT